MMATVPQVTSGLGLRKFKADGFLLTRVYQVSHSYKTTGKIICVYANYITKYRTCMAVLNIQNYVGLLAK